MVWLGNVKSWRSFREPMRRWEDNIKMDLKPDGKAWTGLMWLRI
jgi:hypothetical protein